MRIVTASRSLAEAVQATIVSDMAKRLISNPAAMRSTESVKDFLFSCGFGPQSVHALTDPAVTAAIVSMSGPGCWRRN